MKPGTGERAGSLRRRLELAFRLGMASFLVAACLGLTQDQQPSQPPSPTEPAAAEVDPTATEILTAVTLAAAAETPLPTAFTAEPVLDIGAAYPETAANFVLDAGGSQIDQIDRIRQLAPDDAARMEAMYFAEIGRTGLNPDDYEIIGAIVEGRSWVMVPRHIQTGRFWVPVINTAEGQIPAASLHLFEFLDRDINDDFFNLWEVPADNQQLVFDRSGWWVIGEFSPEGELLRWLDAPNWQMLSPDGSPVPTATLEPTLTMMPTPTPTETLVPPTDTPEPTDIPTVTETLPPPPPQPTVLPPTATAVEIQPQDGPCWQDLNPRQSWFDGTADPNNGYWGDEWVDDGPFEYCNARNKRSPQFDALVVEVRVSARGDFRPRYKMSMAEFDAQKDSLGFSTYYYTYYRWDNGDITLDATGS